MPKLTWFAHRRALAPTGPLRAIVVLAISTLVMLAATAEPAPAAVPAGPAPGTLGSLTLNPDHGTVTDTPMLSAATSGPCPTGYGADATLRIGRGEAFNNLNRPQTGGNYDKAPFTIAANRSMTTSARSTPTDGAYQVIVICTGETLGDNPAVFLATITVRGSSWAVGAPAAPAAAPTAQQSVKPTSTGQDPGPAPSFATAAPPAVKHGGLVWVPVAISIALAVVALASYVSHRRREPAIRSAPPAPARRATAAPAKAPRTTPARSTAPPAESSPGRPTDKVPGR